MKVISKCVNNNLISELNACLRHQQICKLALFGKNIEYLGLTETKKLNMKKSVLMLSKKLKQRQTATKSVGLCRLTPLKCMKFIKDLLDSINLYFKNLLQITVSKTVAVCVLKVVKK